MYVYFTMLISVSYPAMFEEHRTRWWPSNGQFATIVVWQITSLKFLVFGNMLSLYLFTLYKLYNEFMDVPFIFHISILPMKVFVKIKCYKIIIWICDKLRSFRWYGIFNEFTRKLKYWNFSNYLIYSCTFSFFISKLRSYNNWNVQNFTIDRIVTVI